MERNNKANWSPVVFQPVAAWLFCPSGTGCASHGPTVGEPRSTQTHQVGAATFLLPGPSKHLCEKRLGESGWRGGGVSILRNKYIML